MGTTPRKLWQHPDVSSTKIDAFRRAANQQFGLKLETYHDIWEWSTRHINQFWMHVWSFTKVVATAEPSYAIAPEHSTQLFPRVPWFPEARLNFAQNILDSAFAPEGKEQPVVTGIREGSSEIEHATVSQLRARVARLANSLKNAGLQSGDRVACIGVNDVNTLVIFLAAASLGALFTSCSPETGEQGIVDRFLQVRPRVLFAEDAQLYNGKRISCIDKVLSVTKTLFASAGLERTVIGPRFLCPSEDLGSDSRITLLSQFVVNASTRLDFAALRFDDPLLIVYSSGTTGQPKCLVHTVGGVLLKLKLEHILCADMGPDSVYLQYTTTNWIMYLYAVTGQLSGARSILYDGSPTYPSLTGFLELLARQKVTHFGTSAHYLNLLQQAGIKKGDFPPLDHLRVVTSTGSVLTEDQYDWVYTNLGDVHLSSIAGGTDIAGAFVGGAPNLPVYAGWCQARTLGMKVQIYSEGGKAIETSGQPGELVCTSPFPSQPVFFWNDKDFVRYRASYFEMFKGVWTQGDFIRMDPETKGVQFLGRSDGVLNPSGVRFGSAEIYNCLARFEQIEDALCVGQRRPTDKNEHVLLFLKMKQGYQLTEDLVAAIEHTIKTHLSARHVPSFVCSAPEIPMTVNGKKTEIPVKKIVSGQKIVPSSTIVNPNALKWYEQFVILDMDPLHRRKKKSKL